ncbi:MAG: hotdog fold thioesterase [Thermoflavifilum sp.]|nr:hotdog fold thioesterase [Thermoflavifilum sp.]
MHPIWFSLDINLDTLHDLSKGTMSEYLGIVFTEIGPDYLKAMMPVNEKTRQPYGLLHGGASATLAETLGSVAAALVVNPQEKACVGMEINLNHIRPVSEGHVHGIARPLHIGKTTQVWDIRITDDRNKLVSVSRLTVAVIDRQQVIKNPNMSMMP